MGKIRIGGKDYTSLSLTFFNEVMEAIHNGNEYSSDYIPRLKKQAIAFAKRNGRIDEVLVDVAFYSWMDTAYAYATEYPLPWRPQEKINAK